MWGPRTLSCNIGNDALMFPQSDSIYNSGIYSQPAETCWQGPATSWLSPRTTELRNQKSSIGQRWNVGYSSLPSIRGTYQGCIHTVNNCPITDEILIVKVCSGICIFVIKMLSWNDPKYFHKYRIRLDYWMFNEAVNRDQTREPQVNSNPTVLSTDNSSNLSQSMSN